LIQGLILKIINMKIRKKVLAVGAHPDDIEIGCAGTISKWVAEGVEFSQMILTSGGAGGVSDIRKEEQEEAARRLGVSRLFWGDYQDTELALCDTLIGDIESVIDEFKPDVVMTHYPKDTHQDHRVLATAVTTAARYTSNLLYYEGPSTYEFAPLVFVDISEYLTRKNAALAAHASQMDKTNVVGLTINDVAEAMATFRGVECRARRAEAYVPFRFFL